MIFSNVSVLFIVICYNNLWIGTYNTMYVRVHRNIFVIYTNIDVLLYISPIQWNTWCDLNRLSVIKQMGKAYQEIDKYNQLFKWFLEQNSD